MIFVFASVSKIVLSCHFFQLKWKQLSFELRSQLQYDWDQKQAQHEYAWVCQDCEKPLLISHAHGFHVPLCICALKVLIIHLCLGIENECTSRWNVKIACVGAAILECRNPFTDELCEWVTQKQDLKSLSLSYLIVGWQAAQKFYLLVIILSHTQK